MLTSFSPSQWLLTGLYTNQALSSIITTAIAGKIIYNLYFHPLRSYPGPFLGRASEYYAIFWELEGSSHLRINDWHNKYGEVVRIAPNQLSYNSGRAWETICGHRTNNNRSLFEKDQKFFLESPTGEHNIIGAIGEQHRRLRRLLAQAFSNRALQAQEDILQGYINTFISQLRKRASEGEGIVDMMQWLNYITFDLIGDLAFGSSFGLVDQGVWSRYISTTFGMIQFTAWYPAIKRVFPLKWRFFVTKLITPKQMLADRVYQYELAQSKLKKRVSIDTDRKDFVNYMLQGFKEAIGPDGLGFDEMVSVSEILILAGSETVATALSGMLYYLLQETPCLTRLTNEIRSSFESEDEINIKSAASLRYLNAVLEESIRLYPPVPAALPRMVPEPGQIICDRFVPAGTSVGLPHYSCYHSAQNFFEPEIFHPERWLEGEDPRFKDDHRNAFHPFSHGLRNCLGQNLAYAEMRLITCRFFWNFDIQLQPESYNWTDQKTTTLWLKESLMAKLILCQGGNF